MDEWMGLDAKAHVRGATIRGRRAVYLIPEEMDAAAKKAVDYRPPGAGAK